MSTFESIDVTLDKLTVDPDEKTDKSMKRYEDPTFIKSAHSPMYEEIRAIPSSNYYKSPSERVSKNDSIAMLGKS